MNKKEMKNDNVTSIKVNNIQVASLQSLMTPLPILFQKWVHLFCHLHMEERSNADDVACQIRKSHDDDVKNKYSTAGITKFRVQFLKGTEEEFPDE